VAGSALVIAVEGHEVRCRLTRDPQLLLQRLAKQVFGGFLLLPALHQNIENETLLIDGAPEPVLLAGDTDDLIEVPFVAATSRTSTKAVGIFAAKF
jgi:hypothetical protein